MRTITTRIQRGVSLVLVLCMCITAGPVQALAAAQPTVLPTAWSAPFEQPEPVDYEQQNAGAAADEKDDAEIMPGGADSALPAEGQDTPESTGRPSPGEAEKTAPPQQSPDSAEPTTAPGETPTTGADPASSENEPESMPEEEPKSESEDGKEASGEALRQPILRERYDPYQAKYGEPVEVQEYARVFSNSLAPAVQIYTMVVSPIPNTYTDEAGQARGIDNTLALVDQNGVPTYANTANDLEVKLPQQFAPGDGLAVTLDDVSMRLAPMEGDYTRPAALENAVRYNDVFPGVDVQYTAKELMVKEDIILRMPVDRSEYRYLLEAPGLEARIVEGVLNLYRTGEDTPVFTLLAPVMYDAAGQASYELEVGLEKQGNRQIVTVTADRNWLDAPDREYPVIIDPSILNTQKAAASMLTVGRSYYGQGSGYAAVGYAPKTWGGYPGDATKTWAQNRTILYFNDLTDALPENAEVDKAELVLYEYEDLSGGATTFTVSKLNTGLTFADVGAHPNYSNHWDFVQAAEKEFLRSFKSGAGYHRLDVTKAVNDWQKGLSPNYGLMMMAEMENDSSLGARFYPGHGTEPDIAPCIEITWHEVGDVQGAYPLDDTTIEMRPVNGTDRNGKTEFYGVFWDGTATPKSTLTYKLNAEDKGYTGSVTPGFDALYPNSAGFEAVFPAGATKYRRRLSNWQTMIPFVDFEYDTIYTLTAQAAKDGTTGKQATSEPFLIYKVKSFDTLAKIAAHYGVNYDTLAFDNRVTDGLLVENNTLFIRNPKTAEPYNPGTLSTEDKTRIDTYLVGRGLHCEFGLEPVNLNTGNFYLNAADAEAMDTTGTFLLERTYNSKMAGYSSSFGRGWAFSYDESLGRCGDGTIAYRRGDGSTAYFMPDGSGGYVSPAGLHQQLRAIGAGTREVQFGTAEDPDLQVFQLFEYELTDPDGTARRFNTIGMLASVTDPEGRVTRLDYDSRHLLDSITTPSGKVFGIEKNDRGFITRITLPGGAALHYSYDSADRLTGYVDALGAQTSYTYDAEHRMISWADGSGVCMV